LTFVIGCDRIKIPLWVENKNLEEIILMKKELNEAKVPLLVSLYFIAAYGVSLFLTILTHWNFGVFIFGIFIITLIIATKRYSEKTPEHVRR
jgi:hypothetical protein